jgi:hypothetical protein
MTKSSAKLADQGDLQAVQAKLAAVQNTLGSLVTWMAQSANSPISVAAATELLNMLHAND